MRCEDWDVLLFNGPASEVGHVPLREFKTACHALEDVSLTATEMTRSHSVAPLMTSFIPSIDEGVPFQISIHSWVPKHFVYSTPEGTDAASKPTQLWQVKVTIDGHEYCIEHYPEDVQWPKVLTIANLIQADPDGNMRPLRFPRFHRSIMAQQHWDANDMKGRIRIEVSEGYIKIESGKSGFVKLMNHAIFNFQPAPIDVLQRASIAWPNEAIFRTPIKSDAHLRFGHGPSFANRAEHQRNMSASSISSIQSSPSYYNGGRHGMAFNYGPGLVPPNSYTNSSRSSSAYSTIPYAALPPPAAAAIAAAQSPAYPTNTTLHDQAQLRIPSDQLEKILTAINTPKAANASMPPPPLPQHAIEASQANEAEPSGGEERRLANGSDISMHADYQSFPGCTTEDAVGHVVHNPSPDQDVKSRKEGAIDSHNRDFFSHVLNPTSTESSDAATKSSSSPEKTAAITSSSPANGSARKRTRSMTKATIGNNGSPEKVDEDTTKPARKLRRRVTAGPDGA